MCFPSNFCICLGWNLVFRRSMSRYFCFDCDSYCAVVVCKEVFIDSFYPIIFVKHWNFNQTYYNYTRVCEKDNFEYCFVHCLFKWFVLLFLVCVFTYWYCYHCWLCWRFPFFSFFISTSIVIWICWIPPPWNGVNSNSSIKKNYKEDSLCQRPHYPS